jgi:S1-C subfamily serine protease
VAVLLLAGTARLSADDELPSLESAAEKLQTATVTVRVGVAAEADGTDATQPAERGDDAVAPASRVSVFTGVSLGDGLVVTALIAASDARIRITLAGGEQAQAKAVVLDEFSGLALLKLDRTDVPTVERTAEAPKVGSWVISAAAWGAEKPVVMLGLVSGVDRSLPGGSYPPLLQCDMRTAETSSGAGVVNRQGQLLGIVVAADSPEQRRGFAYAVPVSHVERLLRKLAEKEDDDSIILLRRQRPVVGMDLMPEDSGIIVKRVTEGSPAERAGIRVGDKVLAADGVKIRSVYQAVRPILFKQPGDVITFVVEQESGVRSVDVVLGGGVSVDAGADGNFAQLFEPKVVVDGRTALGNVRRGGIAEVFAPKDEPEVATRDPRELLEKALDRYRSVIVYQQAQLAEAEEDRARTQRQLEALEAQVELLKRELSEVQAAGEKAK